MGHRDNIYLSTFLTFHYNDSLFETTICDLADRSTTLTDNYLF